MVAMSGPLQWSKNRCFHSNGCDWYLQMDDSQLRLGSIVTRSTSRARMGLILFDVLDRSIVVRGPIS